MDMMRKAFWVLLLSISPIVHANGSLGVIGAKSESVYKETSSRSASLPNIGYEGEHFYLQLPELGYRFLPRQSLQNFAVGISYEGLSFDPDDSSNTSIQLLDERDPSIMAFASYRLGIFSTKVAQDISGKHDGYYAQVGLGYPIPIGTWKIIPSFSYRHMDNKMSNHLFGISRSESIRTGGAIAAYDSGAISQIRYGVRAIYPITSNANLILGISQTKFDDDILKSPIVEDNTVNAASLGFIFSF
ncbi:outer membrane protein [Marinomonas foliarum]|uniref:Outer membrane protein n=2 Tax=Marinomonas foliarum TaxID=491950 RepID=A0A369AN34_9GAMM|nr:outer membrane protein [Marinomonas foliarum]